MKTIALLILLLFGVSPMINAQVEVSGKVTDINGTPLLGATIKVKDSDGGVVSDLEGLFSTL